MKIVFGAEHTAILNQFKKNEEEYFSADAIQGLTNIEPVRVNRILTELVKHDQLIETNTDKIRDNWLNILSENGKKYLKEHT